MGGPKALLGWPQGEGRVPLAAAHALVRLGAESQSVAIVVRAEVAAVLRGRLPAAARLVCSTADEELGPAGSLAAAARSGPWDGSIIVTPVDCPPVAGETVAILVAALDRDPKARAARPRFGGRGGHPVVLRAALLEHYLRAEPPPLRDLLRELGAATLEVPVTDQAVRLDLDTDADLEAVGAAPPHFIGWSASRQGVGGRGPTG